MMKLFIFLCAIIIFSGIVGCPADDPVTTVSKSSFSSKSVTPSDMLLDPIGNDVFPIPEPVILIMLGAGLVGLAVFGRKNFFK